MTRSHSAVGTRLSVMMFLQFFIWGSWYVTANPFIAAIGWDSDVANDATFWTYTVGPIAAIVSPLFLGTIADRFFATQRVLATMHFLGAAAMLAVPSVVADGAESSPTLLVTLFGLHMLFFMPTLGLTNTLAFHQLDDQERQFPIIRMFGTIGWIAANNVVSVLLEADASATQFYVCGAAGVLLGFYSLSLPHTPPPMKGREVRLGEMLGLDAVGLLKDRSFFVLVFSSFLICIPLAGYYSYAAGFVADAGFERPGSTMSLGQFAEVFFMLVMPLCFARLGVKWMIAVGMLAWVVRYMLFGLAGGGDAAALILGGILLHGICYDFFFVTGQIYVDRAAPKEVRGQAQGFLVLVTQGLGLGIGAQLFGELVARNTVDGVKDWPAIWWPPAMMAGAVLLLFLGLFRNPRGSADGAEPT